MTSEDGRRTTENGRRMTEDRRRMTEDRDRKWEVGMRKWEWFYCGMWITDYGFAEHSESPTGIEQNFDYGSNEYGAKPIAKKRVVDHSKPVYFIPSPPAPCKTASLSHFHYTVSLTLSSPDLLTDSCSTIITTD